MAAIHTVRDLLKAKIETLSYDGDVLTGIIDADEQTPADASQCPAVMIEEGGAEVVLFEGQSGGTVTHQGQFTLTCLHVANGSATSRERAYGIMSVVANALLADFSLSGQVREILPTGYGGETFTGADVEGIPLDLSITFCTANTDFDTLI